MLPEQKDQHQQHILPERTEHILSGENTFPALHPTSQTLNPKKCRNTHTHTENTHTHTHTQGPGVVLQQCPVGPSLVSDAAGTHRGRRALQKCFPHTAIKKYNAYVCISAETQTLAQGRGVQGCHTHTPTDVLDRYQVAARLVAQEYLDHENTHTHTHRDRAWFCSSVVQG